MSTASLAPSHRAISFVIFCHLRYPIPSKITHGIRCRVYLLSFVALVILSHMLKFILHLMLLYDNVQYRILIFQKKLIIHEACLPRSSTSGIKIQISTNLLVLHFRSHSHIIDCLGNNTINETCRCTWFYFWYYKIYCHLRSSSLKGSQGEML
jgi:hypothetical protein